MPILRLLLALATLWPLIPHLLAAQTRDAGAVQTRYAVRDSAGQFPLERSIGDVFDERNALVLPARLGDTIRVRGTIATPTRLARINSRWVSVLQDTRGGVMLVDSTDVLGALDRGAYVEIVGTVQSFNGSEELNVVAMTRLGTRELPAPLSVGPRALDGEALAGRMVRVRARLRVEERQGAGGWMFLDVGGERVQMYLPVGVRDSPRFPLGLPDDGRLVEVDGVAGQYDRTLPYESGYQLIVLDPSAVRTIGVAPISMRRWVALGAAVALVLLLAGVYLRHQSRVRALQQLSFTDPMTGLLNRRGYEHAVQQALEQRHARKLVVALVLVDLDDFKLVNDQHGHLTGDAVLRDVALRLRELVPPEAGMVSRFGGDEFAIVLPDTTAQEASALADRVVAQLRAMRVAGVMGSAPVSIGASAGVATTEGARDTLDAESLLHDADTALYAGKRAGKGRAQMARRLA